MRRELAVALVVLAASCAPRHAFDNPERPPAEREPARRTGANPAEVHDAMWKMARAVEGVNVIFRRTGAPLTRDEQAEVVSLLEELERVAAKLSTDDMRALHPVLGDNIDAFRADLAASRKFASADPPNFFMAGTIAGACAGCHGLELNRVHKGLP